MTTTAATANSSAPTSTPPEDTPDLHEFDDDNEVIEEGSTLKGASEHKANNQPEHNHTKQKCQRDPKRSPSPQQPTPPHPPSQDQSQSSPQSDGVVDVSNTSTTPAAHLTNATTNEAHKQATISSRPPNVTETQTNDQQEQSTSSQQQQQQQHSPHQQSTNTSSNNSTEQKRPMNAFLLFCKRQRSQVKEKYPNLENRGITKILGDWWSKLDKEQKSKYTDLARQHKEAFMKANPDFKWCKTPNVSNIDNNNGAHDTDNETCNNSITNQNQQKHLSQHSQRQHQLNNHHLAAVNVDMLSSQMSAHQPMEVVYHSSNSMDIMLRNRQQLEAPKPPKKRFLERTDSVYTNKNSHGSNQNDSTPHDMDVVSFSFNQNFLNRVIDQAFSEDSSCGPSGVNSCKYPNNRISTNSTTSSNNTVTSFSSSTTTTTTTTSANSYAMNTDEPVDFSMNKTFSATSQQIINNLVEKMLSEGPDNSSSFSAMIGTDGVRMQVRPPVKRDNPDDTRT